MYCEYDAGNRLEVLLDINAKVNSRICPSMLKSYARLYIPNINFRLANTSTYFFINCMIYMPDISLHFISVFDKGTDI